MSENTVMNNVNTTQMQVDGETKKMTKRQLAQEANRLAEAAKQVALAAQKLEDEVVVESIQDILSLTERTNGDNWRCLQRELSEYSESEERNSAIRMMIASGVKLLDYDMDRFLGAIRHIPVDDRKEAVALAIPFHNEEMNVFDRVRLIRAVASVKSTERQSACHLTHKLIDGDQFDKEGPYPNSWNAEVAAQMIENLGKIPATDREDVIAHAKGLCDCAMEKVDKTKKEPYGLKKIDLSHFIRSLGRVPREERATAVNCIKRIGILTSDMVSFVCHINPGQYDAIVDCVSSLVNEHVKVNNESMPEYVYQHLILYLNKLTPKQRKLFSHDMMQFITCKSNDDLNDGGTYTRSKCGQVRDIVFHIHHNDFDNMYPQISNFVRKWAGITA